MIDYFYMERLSTREQFTIWSKVAVHSFGGPAGQISIIYKLLVEEKKIISEEKFLHALNFCMLLPGPEAQQLATYLGWVLGRIRGGLLAGILFILPGFFSILILSLVYVYFYDVSFIEGFFFGVRPGVIILVFSSLLKMTQKTLKNGYNISLAVFGFLALYFLNISFPLVILASSIMGVIHGYFLHNTEKPLDLNSDPAPPLKSTVKTFFLFLLIWLIPIWGTNVILGNDSTLHKMNLLFSKMSLVTFGGAYAALSYVAQRAVDFFQWMSPAQMIDGLAMAESTPGPLIQTVQFVGFMGAYKFPDFTSPIFSALVASVLTTWMTFAPCFLWIFTFAPYVEYLRQRKMLSQILEAISSTVVGVILNLSVWFMMNTLFHETKKFSFTFLSFQIPKLSSIDFYALGLTVLGFTLYKFYNFNPLKILAVTTAIGIILKIFS